MSSSGKQKKKKYRPVDIETILPNAVVRPSTASWAEEVEDELQLSEYALKKINSINLPTAPRAARDLVIDESKIPPNGPFRAYMSNLPFETTEEDVTTLFTQLKIEKIELPRDRQDRMRGFGYIEFKDKSSLLVALQEGELTLKSRLVRISLPTEDESKDSRGGSSFSRNRDMSDRFDRSDKPLEWRAAAPIPNDPDRPPLKSSSGFSRQQNFRDRDRDRDRDGGGSGSSMFRDREPRGSSFADSEKSTSYWRGPRDRDRDRDDRNSDRGGSRPFAKRFGDRDRDRDRDRDDRNASRYSVFGKKFDRDDREREFKREPAPERVAEEPKTRPKIELQPRSKPLDTNPAPAALPSSIFGSAKPVDTARREQEIELKMESTAPASRNRSPMSNVTPTRSRSSSVSSVSSIRRQHPDSAETANESSKSGRADDEREKPKAVEFKEPAPPPPTNVWQKRSEENAAAAAAAQAAEKISSNVVDSTVIDNTSNAEESADRCEETAEESPSPSVDESAYKPPAARSETGDRPATDKPRDQAPTEWTTYSHDSFGSADQAAGGGGGGGRFIGGGSNSSNASFTNSGSNASKYSSFSRDDRRDRRGDRRGDNRRPDSDRRSDLDRRSERRAENSRYFNKSRDDIYGGGQRSESGSYGGPRSQNRDGPFRGRNENGRGRDERGGGGYGGFRGGERREYGSGASLRSSASSSISNLRDEGERCDERKATSDERLSGHEADADARTQTEQPQQQNADERLQSSTTAAAAHEKPLENGDDRPSAGHSDAAPAADQSDLNDNSFSSSKSRRKSIKKKDKGDDLAADKDILKPIENDRKANNQKDDKKKTTDSQVNDKTTNNNNNAKGKDNNRSKKSAKKSRDNLDASQPKQKEEKAPNFQGSNRYELLGDDI